MKSAQITRYGNTSEVININQMNTPNLSAGKVLVNVQVAGINPIDWKIRGRPKQGKHTYRKDIFSG